MRSLFAKIVAWFVLTMVITLTATILISALSYNPYSSPQPTVLSMLLSVGMTEARHAWETGGPEALKDTLARFKSVTHVSELIFADANGTDVLTGEQHQALIQQAHGWSRFPFSGDRGTTFARFSSDGKYCLFVIAAQRSFLAGNLQSTHLLVLVLAVLLCYALAYHLTAPLRRLKNALDQFGRGDLSARAHENRGDELGDLARAFDRMADRIQTLLAAERRLLLDISHELRSPLARLSVAVELARSGGNALPLDRIQKEADRLNALISQMLEVTRAEGDSNRKHERVQLESLVANLVDACSIEARARGCTLALSAPVNVVIDGDPELLHRAIENVVRNAIRYAPADTKIEVSVAVANGRAQVRVRDYGPGVPADALPHLFEPFYRVDSARNRGSGGVGLGLSIARRAVEIHQGTLRASNANPGLLVEIDLPAAPIEGGLQPAQGLTLATK
jgi:two-component system sensor histidine kinase CpxA